LNAGAGRLEILSLETREFRTLATDIASDVIPSWSPDGQKIVYSTESELASNRVFHVKVIDVATGASEVIAEGSQPSWSSSGEQIALLDMKAQKYFSIPVKGGDETLLLKAPGWNSRGPLAGRPVLWSPDQKSVVYNAFYDGGVQAILVDLSTRKERTLTTGRPLVLVDWR
jgi:hypothetical protein